MPSTVLIGCASNTQVSCFRTPVSLNGMELQLSEEHCVECGRAACADCTKAQVVRRCDCCLDPLCSDCSEVVQCRACMEHLCESCNPGTAQCVACLRSFCGSVYEDSSCALVPSGCTNLNCELNGMHGSGPKHTACDSIIIILFRHGA